MSGGAGVLLAFLIGVLGSHLVIGLCAARLLAGAGRWVRFAVVLFFVLLPLTFSLVWAWNSQFPGVGVSLLHVTQSLWLAFAIHLLMALAVVFLCGGVAAVLGSRPEAGRLIRIAGALAIVLTGLGFANAKHPHVREVRIPVRRLSADWEVRTIVHLTDVHLGAVHGRRFLERLVNKVNGLDPDIILITGDLFDVFVADPEPFGEGLARFQSREGVYFVTGNHEAHVGVDRVRQVLERSGMVVLDGRVVTIDGLQFAGVGYPAIGVGRAGGDPFAPSSGYSRDVPCVLLFHTPTGIDASPPDPSDRHLDTYFAPRTDFQYAREAGVDVQLSGHTHGGQTFPFTLLTRHLFGDFASGLHRMGDFAIYVSPGAGTWGPPIRIGTTPEIAVIRLHRDFP